MQSFGDGEGRFGRQRLQCCLGGARRTEFCEHIVLGACRQFSSSNTGGGLCGYVETGLPDDNLDMKEAVMSDEIESPFTPMTKWDE